MKKQASTYIQKKRIKRADVHSKTKHSNNKSSKHYSKKYKGQGR